MMLSLKKTLNESLNHRLSDFILEAIEPPFTLKEFQEFLDSEQYEDREGPIYDMISQGYGEKAAIAFCNWCAVYAYYKHKGATAEKLYNMLKKLNERTIKKILGSGGYGLVMELPGNKVIKFNYQDTMFQPDLVFYKYCQDHPELSCFPKIYKIGSNWVVMEKVKTWTPKVKKLNDCWKYAKEGHWPADMDDIMAFYNEVMKHYNIMSKDFDKKYKIQGDDVDARNCGERSNGELVCFDIVAPNGWWNWD